MKHVSFFLQQRRSVFRYLYRLPYSLREKSLNELAVKIQSPTLRDVGYHPSDESPLGTETRRKGEVPDRL